jgi:hypothetical protein
MRDALTTILAQLSENSPLPSEDGLNGLDTSLDTAPFGSADDALKYIMGEQHHLGDLSESFKTMTNESDIASVCQAIEDCNHHRKLVERARAEFQAENLVPWFRLFLEKFLVAREHTEILGWHCVKVQPRSQTVVHFGPAADRQTLAEIVHRGTSGGKTRSYGYRKDLVDVVNGLGLIGNFAMPTHPTSYVIRWKGGIMCQNLELTDSGKEIGFELIQGHNNERG